MSKIKENSNVIRQYLKDMTSADMSSEQLERHNSIIKMLDDNDAEEDKLITEINKGKNTIVSLIQSQGSAVAPQNPSGEPTPRSLEEIAQSIVNGGK